MPRITPTTREDAPAGSKPLLDAVNKKMGTIPNLLATMAHSPGVLQSYLSFSEALGQTSLSPGVREQVALAVSAANRCDYCLAAHTMIGKGAGVSDQDLADAQVAEASDPKVTAILKLARSIVDNRGFVSDAELDAAKGEGVTDAEALEVVAVVVFNILTNYVHHLTEAEVDFPKVENRLAVSA